MSRKLCGRPTKLGACLRERAKGKQRCIWHWLAAQSSNVQADAAAARRIRLPESAHRSRVPEKDWPAGERWCSGCQSFVPLWYCSGSQCRACKSMAAHGKRLEKVYGIDSAEYDRIFKLQGGRCAICRNKPASIRFAVDHNHKTGAVRGILCKRCNHDLLGGAHDDVAMLYRAIEYLLYPPAERDVRPSRERVLAALAEHLDFLILRDAPRPLSDDPAPF